MFDSLKGKLKGIFKKNASTEALEKEIYEEEKPQTPVPEPVQTAVEQKPVDAVVPEVVKAAPEPVKEGPPLSRKERAKLAKADKKESSTSSAPTAVGTSGKKIKDSSLDDLLWDLEIALMEADVALPVVDEIKEGVRESLLGKKHSRSHSLEEIVEASIKESVRNVLKLNEFDFDSWVKAQKKPAVIMFIGINGTGKTTAIAKVANRLLKENMTIVMAAGDTFRAGAIEQLSIHADKLGCKIIKHSADSDPAAVAFDAIDHAKAKHKDVVLIDTAGRMQTNNNLLDEMKKIVRVAKPDLKIFVGDSLAGNDATEQAKAFDDAVGIDAVILTKIDADSKGGAALSIAHTIGKPIAFVSNGQEYEEIIKFDADWMVNRLFD